MKKTNNPNMAQSLYMFTGKYDMQIVRGDDPDVSRDMTLGRACLNCESPVMGDFIMIPVRQNFHLICGDCIRFFAEGNCEQAPPVENVEMAMLGLAQIMADTSA